MPHTVSGQTASSIATSPPAPPPAAMNPPGGAVSVAYRFRVGAKISAWMSAEQLKDAALHGDLPPEGEVQASGHAEWVVATHVRGLVFPVPIPVEAAVAEPVVHATNGNARSPRFSTFRDLLGLYANGDVEVNIPDPTEFSPAKLCAAGSDHFEITLEAGRSRVFLPYSRVYAIWVTETSTNSTLTYRESHRITIELSHIKH